MGSSRLRQIAGALPKVGGRDRRRRRAVTSLDKYYRAHAESDTDSNGDTLTWGVSDISSGIAGGDICLPAGKRQPHPNTVAVTQ